MDGISNKLLKRIKHIIVQPLTLIINQSLIKVSTGTKNFTSNSARIWNTISTKIDVNVTFVQFKANLKLYLLNNVLEFIYSK